MALHECFEIGTKPEASSFHFGILPWSFQGGMNRHRNNKRAFYWIAIEDRSQIAQLIFVDTLLYQVDY
jgi:hypothetical protein